jgi:AAA15 family ATPase/GTPase
MSAESSSSHLSENIARFEDGKIEVLRSAGIYGANASGKSNLIKAFDALVYIICESGDMRDRDIIPVYKPFLLNSVSSSSPIEFEIEFITERKERYIYRVVFDEKRIISESLDFFPSRTKANLFRRNPEDTWETVTFGNHYKGGKKKFAFFPINSYISKAGNSADAPEFIREIYNYFRSKIIIMKDHHLNQISWRDNQDYLESMAEIISKVDTGIPGFNMKKKPTVSIRVPYGMDESDKRLIFEKAKLVPIFRHDGSNDSETEFSESMESSGTMKFFNLIPLLLTIFDTGGILIMDELENSLHPHLAELILKLFNNSEVNKNNAQLIFSTHNINLMNPELLRRDQIWLTEKKDGETTLTSLDEFDKKSVKIDSPFNKMYDDGRFGAIPSIDIHGISEAIKRRLS